MFDKKRREFITLLGGAAAAWPLAARAQQPAMPVIGFLGSGSPDQLRGPFAAFRQGLSEAGYVEGQNVAIEYRWAEGQYDRLPALVADLVRRQVTVIVAVTGTPPALAAKAATTTIPIVFVTAGDPVAARTCRQPEPAGRQHHGRDHLERGARAEAARSCCTNWSPRPPSLPCSSTRPIPPMPRPISRDMQAAARTLGLQLHVLHASTERDIDTVFATLLQLRAGALVIGTDPFFNSRSEQLVALAVRHAMPDDLSISRVRRWQAA